MKSGFGNFMHQQQNFIRQQQEHLHRMQMGAWFKEQQERVRRKQQENLRELLASPAAKNSEARKSGPLEFDAQLQAIKAANTRKQQNPPVDRVEPLANQPDKPSAITPTPEKRPGLVIVGTLAVAVGFLLLGWIAGAIFYSVIHSDLLYWIGAIVTWGIGVMVTYRTGRRLWARQ